MTDSRKLEILMKILAKEAGNDVVGHAIWDRGLSGEDVGGGNFDDAYDSGYSDGENDAKVELVHEILNKLCLLL